MAPQSHSGAVIVKQKLVEGKDAISAGQASVQDPDVPTGCVVKFIEIQYSAVNLVTAACFVHSSIMLLHSGQSIVDPALVGGNPLRNQVFHQQMWTLGADQNSNHVLRFKIPKKYQRVREGDTWNFTVKSNVTFTDAIQVIYKFYQ